jgi:CRISPR/Cas system CMR-associated protein Cmr5 small subunit
MKAVNNMLQAADDAIKASTGNLLNEGGKSIDEIYKNYTAQICVSIVQAGLVPALAYFIEDSESKDGKSSYVANALALMLGHANGQALITHAQSLHNNKPAGRLLKQKVINAAIALKIMMKTYHIIKKDKTA